jgi:transposase InsO family protein
MHLTQVLSIGGAFSQSPPCVYRILDSAWTQRTDGVSSRSDEGSVQADSRRTGFALQVESNVDLFVIPTIAFRILYCLVIIRHGRRIWLSFGVTENPTAEWISRQITEAFPWDHAPQYLIRDRDASYGPAFVQRLRGLGIRDRPIAFRSPWQNAYVERLIGSIRRECLDHMIVFGQAHLRRIVGAYAAYYNEARTHRSLNKDAPVHRAIERLGTITSHPILGGLHHQYCRI